MDPMQAKLKEARVARLATVDAEGRPHMVPVCFAYDGEVFYTAVDHKPKRIAPEKLARVKNIQRSPQVALLIDHYDDDWSKLWYVLVRGEAKLVQASDVEHAKAVRALKAKYPQYAAGMLAQDAPIIRINVERIISWGKI